MEFGQENPNASSKAPPNVASCVPLARELARLAWWAACLLTSSCGQTSSNRVQAEPDAAFEPDGSPDVDAADATDDASPDARSPEECDTDTPYLDEDCLRAWYDECDSRETETACIADRPSSLGVGFACYWARIVKVSNAVDCEVEAAEFRCVTVGTQEFLGCIDACPDSDAISTSWSADTETRELVNACPGPIGPWSFVGNDASPYALCGENILPEPPDLCNCAEAACAAE